MLLYMKHITNPNDIFQGRREGVNPNLPPGSACRPFPSSPQPRWPVPGWAWSLQPEWGEWVQGECKEWDSTAWAGSPPIAGQAGNKGRGSSRLRMMGNPDSSPAPSPHPCPSSTCKSFSLASEPNMLLFPPFIPTAALLHPSNSNPAFKTHCKCPLLKEGQLGLPSCPTSEPCSCLVCGM